SARHAYEISQLIEKQSAGQLKFHVASLYPLLYRLEERGWLQGRGVEKAGQQRRRVYRLTAAGRRAGGSGKPVSGVPAFTGSPPKAAGSSPASGTPGEPSSPRCG